MDFEEELRKFVRSDMPLRQMRESAQWQIEIWMGSNCLLSEARDVSRGGLGVVATPDVAWQELLIVGAQVLLGFVWDDKNADSRARISARIIWVNRMGQRWSIGFEFFNLDHEADLLIERYLVARIVSRHLDDDNA